MVRRSRGIDEEELFNVQKASRLALEADAPTSQGANSEGRPRRSNRGKGGALAQLAAVGDQIRPDLNLQVVKRSKTKEIPSSVPVNHMAPPEKRRRGLKPKDVGFRPVSDDPPLGLKVPTPSLANARPGSAFGFDGDLGHEIDEHSPDEDERAALQFLQQKSRVTPPHSDCDNPGDAPEQETQDFDIENDDDDVANRQRLSENDDDDVPNRRMLSENDDNDVPSGRRLSCRQTVTTDDDADEESQSVLDMHHRKNGSIKPPSHACNDTSRPRTDAAHPHADASHPRADTSHPHNGASHPRADASRPRVDASHPRADASRPCADTSRAHADASRPRTGASRPHADTSRACAEGSDGRGADAFPRQANMSRSRVDDSSDHHSSHPPHYRAAAPRSNPKISNAHRAQTASHHSEASDPEADGDDGDMSDGITPTAARATRNSKPRGEALPTQLGYYSGPWVDVLAIAKVHYRKLIHTSDPFPERNADSLKDAYRVLLEAVAKYQDENGIELDDAVFRANCNGMTVLVFEEGASTRGRLKTMARDIVKFHFKDALEPRLDFGHNSNDYQEVIASNIQNILSESLFLQGPLDAQGRSENFGHSVIFDLSKKFYYHGKPDCLSINFRDMFKTFPRACLAMVCACIVNCLREWVSGYEVKIPFSGDQFESVHEAFLALMNELEEDAYHGAKFKILLKQIATEGRSQALRRRGNAASHGFKVIRD